MYLFCMHCTCFYNAVADILVLVRSTTAVAVAASATLVNGLVSLCLQLDLHWPLAIATLRWALAIQLTLRANLDSPHP